MAYWIGRSMIDIPLSQPWMMRFPVQKKKKKEKETKKETKSAIAHSSKAQMIIILTLSFSLLVRNSICLPSHWH